MNTDLIFVATPPFPIDRFLWLLAIAALAAVWYARQPGTGRLLIVVGAVVAAVGTAGTHFGQPGGLIVEETLGPVERRGATFLWMASTFLEAGGRLTALIGLGSSILREIPKRATSVG